MNDPIPSRFEVGTRVWATLGAAFVLSLVAAAVGQGVAQLDKGKTTFFELSPTAGQRNVGDYLAALALVVLLVCLALLYDDYKHLVAERKRRLAEAAEQIAADKNAEAVAITEAADSWSGQAAPPEPNEDRQPPAARPTSDADAAEGIERRQLWYVIAASVAVCVLSAVGFHPAL